MVVTDLFSHCCLFVCCVASLLITDLFCLFGWTPLSLGAGAASKTVHLQLTGGGEEYGTCCYETPSKKHKCSFQRNTC